MNGSRLNRLRARDQNPRAPPIGGRVSGGTTAWNARPHDGRRLRSAVLPEPTGYRVKRKLLGPPLHSERLQHETLGRPTALAVFASDNLSSCAYATEEILRVLVDRRPRRRRDLLVGHPDHHRPAGGPRVPDPVLPADDQGLPVGRRRVHRHPRQLRPAPRTGRRRRAADRLHPHGGSVRRRRQPMPSPRRVPSTGAGVKHWIAIGFILRHRLRKPARHQGVRQAVRRHRRTSSSST